MYRLALECEECLALKQAMSRPNWIIRLTRSIEWPDWSFGALIGTLWFFVLAFLQVKPFGRLLALCAIANIATITLTWVPYWIKRYCIGWKVQCFAFDGIAHRHLANKISVYPSIRVALPGGFIKTLPVSDTTLSFTLYTNRIGHARFTPYDVTKGYWHVVGTRGRQVTLSAIKTSNCILFHEPPLMTLVPEEAIYVAHSQARFEELLDAPYLVEQYRELIIRQGSCMLLKHRDIADDRQRLGRSGHGQAMKDFLELTLLDTERSLTAMRPIRLQTEAELELLGHIADLRRDRTQRRETTRRPAPRPSVAT